MIVKPCFIIDENVRKEYMAKIRSKRILARSVLLESGDSGIVVRDSVFNCIRAYFTIRKLEKTEKSKLIEEI